ncbi:MAG TPA: DHHA1 domain-containing protein [Terriglobales bacterium]|nr:DHHA1 domain-containing protein [Terriglobales bacterium]
MTEHLYYHDSFLYEFDAAVADTVTHDSRSALVLDRTAFYPASGGQAFDTGWIVLPDGEAKLRVAEVAEQEDGSILHLLETPATVVKGTRIHGVIDAERRRDHMQQHSGQHVLSAAFVRLFDMPTVSFHMGADYCSIDLDTKTLSQQQVEAAEKLSNEVIAENRPVDIRFVSQEEAVGLGLRKLPPAERDQLRLIEMRDFDLTACGGTHVQSTGQIGGILLRKMEKVRQGWRVEFVCGLRAVATARRDYLALTEAAGALSTHTADVPQQIRKLQEDLRATRKGSEQSLADLAELSAGRLLEETPETTGRKVVLRTFADRDLTFIKLLAQKLTRKSPNVIALLGATAGQPALVFGASPGMPFDMGALMKEALAKLGGRGGGSKDMAQGGPQGVEEMETVLRTIADRLSS